MYRKQALFGFVKTRSYSLNRFQYTVTHILGYICSVLAPGRVVRHTKFLFGSFWGEAFCGTYKGFLHMKITFPSFVTVTYSEPSSEIKKKTKTKKINKIRLKSNNSFPLF